MNEQNEAAANVDGAFLSVLQKHRRGGALSDLADAMREVTDAVKTTGKGGSFTFKVTIRPASRGGALIVEDEVKMTLPKETAEGSIFFADDRGNLLREDPNQQTLPLRSIDGGAAEETKPLLKAGEHE